MSVSIFDAATFLCIADTGSASDSRSATLAVGMSTTQYPIIASKTESLTTASTVGFYSLFPSTSVSSTTVASFSLSVVQPKSPAQSSSSIIQVHETQTVGMSSVHTLPSLIFSIPTPSFNTMNISTPSSDIPNISATSKQDIRSTVNPTTISSMTQHIIVASLTFHSSQSLSQINLSTNQLYTSTLDVITVTSVSSLLFSSVPFLDTPQTTGMAISSTSPSALHPIQIPITTVPIPSTSFSSASIASIFSSVVATANYSVSSLFNICHYQAHHNPWKELVFILKAPLLSLHRFRQAP